MEDVSEEGMNVSKIPVSLRISLTGGTYAIACARMSMLAATATPAPGSAPATRLRPSTLRVAVLEVSVAKPTLQAKADQSTTRDRDRSGREPARAC